MCHVAHSLSQSFLPIRGSVQSTSSNVWVASGPAHWRPRLWAPSPDRVKFGSPLGDRASDNSWTSALGRSLSGPRSERPERLSLSGPRGGCWPLQMLRGPRTQHSVPALFKWQRSSHKQQSWRCAADADRHIAGRQVATATGLRQTRQNSATRGASA